MVIFNLWAIPVAVLVYLAVAGINHLFPAVANDHYFPFVAGTTMFVIGGIGEWIGVKARVFFLPVWLLGIAVICVKLGPIGWVLLGLIVVVCVIWLVRWTKKKDAEEWQQAQAELAKSPTPPTLKELEFWNWVKTTLYLPLGTPTPEQCAHDLKVLQGVRSARPVLTPPEAAGFVGLEAFFEKNKNEAKCPGIENKLQQAIANVIQQKIKKAKPEVAFRVLSSTPPEMTASR